MSSLIPLAGLVLVTAMNASAQTTPADASPQSSPSRHGSAFDAYRPFAQEAVLPWKEANDTVGKIGGWRAYAKEASVAPPQAATASAPGAAKPPSVHGKH